MDDLKRRVKEMIVERLGLEGLRPEEIDDDAPLFGEGLGLDSIDALELGLAVKNRYGVVLSAESDEMRQHFFSVATLAAFIDAQRT